MKSYLTGFTQDMLRSVLIIIFLAQVPAIVAQQSNRIVLHHSIDQRWDTGSEEWLNETWSENIYDQQGNLVEDGERRGFSPGKALPRLDRLAGACRRSPRPDPLQVPRLTQRSSGRWPSRGSATMPRETSPGSE